MTQTKPETTDPVLQRLDLIAKRLDSIWSLLFLGLIGPLWLVGIVWIVLANSSL